MDSTTTDVRATDPLDPLTLKTWMRRELLYQGDAYMDCGEVNCTALGEAYAEEADLGEQIPEEVWDAAFEASQWFLQ